MTGKNNGVDLIDKIGKAAVADRFELSAQAVNNWHKRGVPMLRRRAFARFAAEHGVAVSREFLAPLDLDPIAADLA